YSPASGDSNSGLTYFRPPSDAASGWATYTWRVGGAPGLEKSSGAVRPSVVACVVFFSAACTPARVRSLSAHAWVSTWPQISATAYPYGTPQFGGSVYFALYFVTTSLPFP